MHILIVGLALALLCLILANEDARYLLGQALKMAFGLVAAASMAVLVIALLMQLNR